MKVWASTSLSFKKCPKHQTLHIWGGNVPHYSWAIVHLGKEGPWHQQRAAGTWSSVGCVFPEGRTLAPTLEHFSQFYEHYVSIFLVSLRNHRAPLPRLSACSQGYWSSSLWDPCLLLSQIQHFTGLSEFGKRGEAYLCTKHPISWQLTYFPVIQSHQFKRQQGWCWFGI